MRVINPIEIKDTQNDFLIKEIIDYFNLSVLSMYNVDFLKEQVIELKPKHLKSIEALDDAVLLLNINGWVAKHENYYSFNNACPSYAIFFKQKI